MKCSFNFTCLSRHDAGHFQKLTLFFGKIKSGSKKFSKINICDDDDFAFFMDKRVSMLTGMLRFYEEDFYCQISNFLWNYIFVVVIYFLLGEKIVIIVSF